VVTDLGAGQVEGKQKEKKKKKGEEGNGVNRKGFI